MTRMYAVRSALRLLIVKAERRRDSNHDEFNQKPTVVEEGKGVACRRENSAKSLCLDSVQEYHSAEDSAGI